MKFVIGSLILLFLPTRAVAHGIGEVYALPIPLHYYVLSTAFAVALSFIILGIFFNKKRDAPLQEEKSVHVKGLRSTLLIAKYCALFLFVLTILTGLIGTGNIYSHFAPIFFWVYFFIGMGILTVVVGNIWDKLNPFKTITDKLYKDHVPEKYVSRWVGVILLFLFIWFELVSFSSFVPSTISSLLILYLVVNIAGAYRYANWYEDGELFSVMFNFIGKLAHWRINDKNTGIIIVNEQKKLSGILPHLSLLFIAALLLAGATFDSIKETAFWFEIFEALGFTMSYINLQIFNTLGLILTPLYFIGTYFLAIWFIRKITGSNESIMILAKQFIYSLIPIAFGYILAHNFSLFIVSGPPMFSLISDPFGFGWNIFNTAHYVQNELILGAKLVWSIEIGFILLAHIVGVWYAHTIALNVFKDPKTAFNSQYPLVILMVCYTALTLWLISQPLVVSTI